MGIELSNIHIQKLILTLISIGLIFFLRVSLLKIIDKFEQKYKRLRARALLLMKYTNFVTFFLILVALLFIWGVNFKQIGIFMSSIFAVIGVAFFAQWSILSNITSGIIMFFTFPYKVGDFVKIHEGDYSIYGYIKEIKSFHVVIRSIDRDYITYPNSLMLQKAVTILSKESIRKLKLSEAERIAKGLEEKDKI